MDGKPVRPAAGQILHDLPKKNMFKHVILLTIVCVGVWIMAGFPSLCHAQGDYTLTVSHRVAADPGQTNVPVYLVLTSSSPIGGADIFLQYDRNLLTCSGVTWLTRFQYIICDTSISGKIRIILRRHRADSTSLGPLPSGTDTLGAVKMNVTTTDLLADMETPIGFWENPLTPHEDNRLVKSDSSFIVPPGLTLQEGSVLIRHPLYGDINDDGYPYTIADVIFLVNSLLGNQSLTSRQRANSDVNKDGVQGSMADFIELIKIVAED